MVVSAKLQRRLALRRKLHILRIITNSKSVKRSSVIRDAFIYIYNLKLKLEAIKKELAHLNAAKQRYLSLINQAQFPKEEVKVEKVAGKGYNKVKVVSEKTENKLVSILEAFEEMGVTVLHARVSCKLCFVLEAIVSADLLDEDTITQALLNAIKI